MASLVPRPAPLPTRARARLRAARALAGVLGVGAARDRIACAISAKAAAPLEALPFAEIRVAASPDETALLARLGKPPGGV